MKAQVEVIQSSIPDNETIEGTEPNIYFHPPTSIHQTIRLKDEVANNGWFKAVRKEFTQLVKSGTFDITVKPNPGEPIIDIMETNKIKFMEFWTNLTHSYVSEVTSKRRSAQIWKILTLQQQIL